MQNAVKPENACAKTHYGQGREPPAKRSPEAQHTSASPERGGTHCTITERKPSASNGETVPTRRHLGTKCAQRARI
eukprot:15484337-Alexandrium_andersonii.AAC.2